MGSTLNQPLSERLRMQFTQLSKSHQRVVEQLTREPDLLVFATAAEVARSTGVSEATVTRLAHALGYPGFPAMQEAAQASVRSERTRVVANRASELGDGAGVLARVLAHDETLLRLTQAQIDPAEFQRAVELVAGARHTFVAGSRTSYALAVFLGYTLRMQLGAATILEVNHPHFHHDLSEMGPDTVLVAITFPRYTESTVRLTRYAKGRGCRIVAITDSPLSPVGRLADVALTAAIESPAAATDSYVAPLSVVTALSTGVVLRRKAEVDQHLARIEESYGAWQRLSYVTPHKE